MRHYLILMRPLWREMIGNMGQGMGLGASRRKKKVSLKQTKFKSTALMVFIYGILAFYSVIYGMGITRILLETGNPDGFIQMVALGAPALVLLFGVLQAIPTLYHESNLEILLVLPIKPQVIIAGKLTQAFLPVLLFPFTIFYPALITHGIMTGRPWLFFVQSLPFMLLITLAPFAVVTILLMILMRYTKLARDKDRFQMVTSIVVILLAVGFSLFINMQSSSQMPGASLFAPDGSAPLLSGALPYLPSSWLANGMLVYADSWYSILNGLAALLFNLAVLALLFFLAKHLYLPGVLGMKAGGKEARKLTRDQTMRALGPRSAYRAILARDIKLLLRTPAFFTQTVLAVVLLPLLMIGIMVITFIQLEKAPGMDLSFLALLKFWGASGQWKESLWLLVLISSGVAAFFSGTNTMSASAISRQGKLFAYSKLAPVPIHTQVMAWLTPGITCMTFLWLGLSLGITLFLAASWLFGLLVFVTAWVNAYLVQIVSFYTDMAFPVLDWTNEIQPVKNTKAALVSSLGMFVYIGIVVGVAFLLRWLSGGSDYLTTAGLMIFILLLVGLASWLVVRRAGKLFKTLDI